MPVLQQSTRTFYAGLWSLGKIAKMFLPKYWNAVQEQKQVNKKKDLCLNKTN